jgi:hypothetical protein
MPSEMNTVVKKINPYLQRRGYSLDDNLFFGERAENLHSGTKANCVRIPNACAVTDSNSHTLVE